MPTAISQKKVKMLKNLLKSLAGDPHQREIQKLQPLVEEIIALASRPK